MLGILPWDFWRLTPAEFGRLIKGAKKREDSKWQLAAWVTANLMNISGKRLRTATSPQKLLGKVLKQS